VLGRHLLGDAAAERIAQQVDFRQAEQVDESDRVADHRCNIVGGLAGRAADAGVVERDHGTIGSQGAHVGRVPGINVARDVLQQNQRHSG